MIPSPRHSGPAPTRSFCWKRQLWVGGFGAALITAAALCPVRLGVVSGCSMEPTLKPGSFFLYRRMQGSAGQWHRGDIVVVRLGGVTCVKRVFATGGDTFWTFNWGRPDEVFPQLLSQQARVAEWKLRYPTMEFRRRVVPAGHLYVLGDGIRSVDSRQYGPVRAEDVLGRVVTPMCPGRTPEYVAWTEVPRRPRRRS